MKPDDARVWFNLGVAYAQEGVAVVVPSLPVWNCDACGARFEVKCPEGEAGEEIVVANVDCLACGAPGMVSLPRSIADAKAYWLEAPEA